MMRSTSRLRWSSRRARQWLAGGALLAAGGTAGVVAATSSTAGAATTTTAASTGSSGSSSSTGSTSRPAPPANSRYPYGLDQSGTVTAVGSSTVTIQTTAGNTTYAVVANSDIDKNGEAELSNLVVGDKVKFNYVTSGTTKTIAHIHAGNEALNKPTADGGGAGSGDLPGGPGGPGGFGGPGGPPPASSGSSSTSGGTTAA